MGRLGDEFRFTLITRNPALAERADAAGVDCIGVDIERLNKSARQGHIAGARISDHELSDLGALAPVASRAVLFARAIFSK
jgi:4'-phosphopantetheinyl transferase EntD